MGSSQFPWNNSSRWMIIYNQNGVGVGGLSGKGKTMYKKGRNEKTRRRQKLVGKIKKLHSRDCPLRAIPFLSHKIIWCEIHSNLSSAWYLREGRKVLPFGLQSFQVPAGRTFAAPAKFAFIYSRKSFSIGKKTVCCKGRLLNWKAKPISSCLR